MTKNLFATDGNGTITGFADDNEISVITIPSEINGEKITTIGDTAFDEDMYLWKVTIEPGISKIGDWAFSSCVRLTDVSIPDTVVTICTNAFDGCNSLTNVTIPRSAIDIELEVFDGCSSLTAINVDENNTSYCSVDGVMFNKDKTKLIKYPEGKTETEYTIPDGVVTIGHSAFSNSINLETVNIPDSVTSIGDKAFMECFGLTDVNLPNNLISIGTNAFDGCSALTNIIMPPNMKFIGDNAFSSCVSLTNMTIPDSVNIIGYGAFSDCHDLTTVSISNNVLGIGEQTFWSCINLSVVIIGKNVTKIDHDAFKNCKSLATVYYNGTKEEWNEIVIAIGNDKFNKARKIFNYESETQRIREKVENDMNKTDKEMTMEEVSAEFKTYITKITMDFINENPSQWKIGANGITALHAIVDIIVNDTNQFINRLESDIDRLFILGRAMEKEVYHELKKDSISYEIPDHTDDVDFTWVKEIGPKIVSEIVDYLFKD